MSGIKSHQNQARQCRPRDRRFDVMQLLGPTPENAEWEAEKAGWRSFVMGNANSAYRRGTKLIQTHQDPLAVERLRLERARRDAIGETP